MLLDEVVFEQQRFGLGVGDRDLDACDMPDQRLHLGIDVAREEIVAHAIAQAARLADIQKLAVFGVHAIDAGPPRQIRDVFPRIEMAGVLAHALDDKPASVAARFSTL